jgi:6-phosphogluconolactonase
VAFSDAGDVVHLVDLGTDSIVSHRLSDDAIANETASLSVPAGSGPRHMVLSRDASRAWVFCELDESLIALTRAGLGWQIDTVQPGFAAPRGEDGSGAAIRLSPDERHIYISGRRQSRIAGFDLDGNLIGETDCGGLSPRDFIAFSDGHWVIAANQTSNTLTSLRRDPATGLLALSGHSCDIGSPVALVEVLSIHNVQVVFDDHLRSFMI